VALPKLKNFFTPGCELNQPEAGSNKSLRDKGRRFSG
jgi:hypothetical protein